MVTVAAPTVAAWPSITNTVVLQTEYFATLAINIFTIYVISKQCSECTTCITTRRDIALWQRPL